MPRHDPSGDASRPAPEAPRPRRRLLRGAAVLVLIAASLAWAGIDRGLDAGDRTRTYVEHGLPTTPTRWTRLRAVVLGPPHVAIQIGHLDADAQPDELAPLRASTGAQVGTLREVDVNRAVAEALAAHLTAAGVVVELLPATVPPRYRADVMISLHADANPDPGRSGYKSAHSVPARNGREPLLKSTVDAAYLGASRLPDDDANVTGAMLGYYAFADHRVRHAAHRSTAGLIVELGYLSHREDRAWLAEPERPATALADGILRYLAALERWHPSFAPPMDARGTAESDAAW